jgi:phage shock protein PspC (stress-responsive transcriptional regulator)
MNKTININLANTFFHIDEQAYLKLQRYLEAVKRSFSKSQGEDEIISDIEARIAELFSERLQHDRQVITNKEVEEIISIMGQPEDYLVDEELFEDQPRRNAKSKSKTHKQLFRDIDNKYIGGVCAGLGHYLGLDALWIRILFIILAVFSLGSVILLYVILWILVPKAITTAQKIAMAGDPVNISNIEKKIKEGFEDVTEKVKSVDYDKMGATVKKNSKNFFDTLASIFMVLVNVCAKLIGIIILVAAASILISLLYGLITAGTMELWGAPWNDYIHATLNAPIWLISLLSFIAVGIPLFFLFYLGLKILVNNLKSIGNFAKFTLLALWILSIIGISIIGIKTATSYAIHATTSQIDQPELGPEEVLEIRVASNDVFNQGVFDSDGFVITDIGISGENKSIFLDDVELEIKAADDDKLKIEIEKESQGESQRSARNKAEAIIYNYSLESGVLILDNYISTAFSNGFRDQEAKVTVYIPSNVTLKLHPTTKYYFGRKNNMDYGYDKISQQKWRMDENGTLICVDCPNPDKNKNIEQKQPDTIKDTPADTIAVKSNNTEIKKDSI